MIADQPGMQREPSSLAATQLTHLPPWSCIQVMEAVVRAYVHLWAKQRPGVHAALAALLSALTSKAAALQDMLQQLVTMMLAATLAEPDPDSPLGELTELAFQPQLLGASSLLLRNMQQASIHHTGLFLLVGPAAVTDEVEAPWRTYIHCWQALLQGSSTDVRPHAITTLVLSWLVFCAWLCTFCA